MDEELCALARRVAEALQRQRWMLATAESCTGGWVAKVMTDLPGSSHWFERGFVTYTRQSKHEMLGVAQTTLERFGAVSEQTVSEMVLGALSHSRAQVGLAVSGIAGPGGATAEKPLGMVCFGWALAGRSPLTRVEHFSGDREQVRRQAVITALEGVLHVLAEG